MAGSRTPKRPACVVWPGAALHTGHRCRPPPVTRATRAWPQGALDAGIKLGSALRGSYLRHASGDKVV